MTRKAVVLARGLGTRMQAESPEVQLGRRGRELAGAGLKGLIPIHGRPFLDYVADGLLRAGLREICLVIAPRADLMRRHAGRIRDRSGARVSCAVQPEPLGTADAVLAAEGFVGADPFVLVNADNLYPPASLQALADLEGPCCWVVAFDRDSLVAEGNIAPERARDFAVVTADQEGRLQGIVEKPEQPARFARQGKLWVSMNLYRFDPVVFDECRRVEPDPQRGELELTGAVDSLAASAGVEFRVIYCEGGVLDLTSRADVPAVERALAERRLSF